jgi:hypothetical protein
MLRQYRPLVFAKVVAAAATPEFLAEGLRLYGFQLVAQKALGTDNTGNITIVVRGVDAKILEPGEEWTWPMPEYEAGYLDSKDFVVRVLNDGDGVMCLANVLI